jgi:hypothetical protein
VTVPFARLAFGAFCVRAYADLRTRDSDMSATEENPSEFINHRVSSTEPTYTPISKFTFIFPRLESDVCIFLFSDKHHRSRTMALAAQSVSPLGQPRAFTPRRLAVSMMGSARMTKTWSEHSSRAMISPSTPIPAMKMHESEVPESDAALLLLSVRRIAHDEMDTAPSSNQDIRTPDLHQIKAAADRGARPGILTGNASEQFHEVFSSSHQLFQTPARRKRDWRSGNRPLDEMLHRRRCRTVSMGSMGELRIPTSVTLPTSLPGYVPPSPQQVPKTRSLTVFPRDMDLSAGFTEVAQLTLASPHSIASSPSLTFSASFSRSGDEDDDDDLGSTSHHHSDASKNDDETTLAENQATTKKHPSRRVVGTTVAASQPVRAVLRRKFSWKNYVSSILVFYRQCPSHQTNSCFFMLISLRQKQPELEGYLIANRDKYLQFSSTHNYTAEQKRYNNLLTQGLLDAAEREGYLFEDFSFAAVRDRIRCYYKSYQQAVKKKQRKLLQQHASPRENREA